MLFDWMKNLVESLASTPSPRGGGAPANRPTFIRDADVLVLAGLCEGWEVDTEGLDTVQLIVDEEIRKAAKLAAG
jgi:hypothetical protein